MAEEECISKNDTKNFWWQVILDIGWQMPHRVRILSSMNSAQEFLGPSSLLALTWRAARTICTARDVVTEHYFLSVDGEQEAGLRETTRLTSARDCESLFA